MIHTIFITNKTSSPKSKELKIKQAVHRRGIRISLFKEKVFDTTLISRTAILAKKFKIGEKKIASRLLRNSFQILAVDSELQACYLSICNLVELKGKIGGWFVILSPNFLKTNGDFVFFTIGKDICGATVLQHFECLRKSMNVINIEDILLGVKDKYGLCKLDLMDTFLENLNGINPELLMFNVSQTMIDTIDFNSVPIVDLNASPAEQEVYIFKESRQQLRLEKVKAKEDKLSEKPAIGSLVYKNKFKAIGIYTGFDNNSIFHFLPFSRTLCSFRTMRDSFIINN
jgi:hypothetical protein